MRKRDDARKQTKTNEGETPDDQGERPVYIPPSVTTYTEAELLAALGPAQAGSVGGDNVFGQ